MNPERYQPSPEECSQAEVFLTSEEKRLSDEREAAIEASIPGRINEKFGSLLLPFDKRLITLDRLDVLAEAEKFHRKPEFHITLLGFATGKILLDRLARLQVAERADRLEKINSLIAATDWTPVNSSDTIQRIAKDYVVADEPQTVKTAEHRESLIQMVDLAGTHTFFHNLNALLETNFEPPATHVTLYTKSSDPKNATLGIGIKSKAELESLEPTNVEY